MSKIIHDVVATIGEYTDREGNTKKRFQKCGAAFTNEDGQISIKLDAVPCSPDWSGWLSLYEKKEYEQPRQPQNRPLAEPARQQPVTSSSADQDDIPF